MSDNEKSESLDLMIQSDVENLQLYSDSFPFNLSLRIKNFETEKDYLTFAKSCEKMIRGSLEYKLWRKYITDVLQVTNCAITEESMFQCTIDIHHHLPGLFYIVKAFMNKKIEEEKTFSSFDIATEVIEFHFANRVGYVPLLSSIHEKFHNGNLLIPVELVKGDYVYFMENYLKYLDDKDVAIITERLSTRMANLPHYTWSKDNYPGIAAEG